MLRRKAIFCLPFFAASLDHSVPRKLEQEDSSQWLTVTCAMNAICALPYKAASLSLLYTSSSLLRQHHRHQSTTNDKKICCPYVTFLEVV